MNPGLTEYVKKALQAEFDAVRKTLDDSREAQSISDSSILALLARDMLDGVVCMLQKLVDHRQLTFAVKHEGPVLEMTAKFMKTMDEADMRKTGNALYSINELILPRGLVLRVYSGHMECEKFVDVRFDDNPGLWHAYFQGETFVTPWKGNLAQHRSTVRLHIDLTSFNVGSH